MLEALLSIACCVIFGACCYTIGHEHGFVAGRKNTIHAMFYGEKDYKRYFECEREAIELFRTRADGPQQWRLPL